MSGRMSAEIVAELRCRFAAGEGITTVARDLRLDEACALRAARGDTYRRLPMLDLSGRIRRPRHPSGEDHPLRRHPHRRARGERHGMAKLTEARVIDIRQRGREGEKVGVLARDHGVSKRCIEHVLSDRTWREIHAPDAGIPVRAA